MTSKNHTKTFTTLRHMLDEVERCLGTERSVQTQRFVTPDLSSLNHDISVAASTLRLFFEALEMRVPIDLNSMRNDNVPVFATMNSMLFNDKKFRDVINKIMSQYYGYYNSAGGIKSDARIVLLGQIIEALAFYIKEERSTLSLLEDETFCNTISLMKINRILQLKNLKTSELDLYRDFSVEKTMENCETTIENCVATSIKSRKSNRPVIQELTILRHLRAELRQLRTVLHGFETCLVGLLCKNLEFATYWKEALANENFGYAVEIYVEKCSLELEQAKQNPSLFLSIRKKLQCAENLLLALESKAHMPNFPEDVKDLQQSFKDLMPLYVKMCLDTVGHRFKQLIGEVNLRNYDQLRLVLISGLEGKEKAVQLVSHSRLKSLDSGQTSEKHGISRVTKIAELFKLSAKLGHKKTSSRTIKPANWGHPDIIEGYNTTFSQTLAVLKTRGFDFE